MIRHFSRDLFLAITSVLLSSATAFADELSLNGKWEFKQSTATEWMDAKVPGHVHLDLMDNDKIDNPFLGVNEKRIQWIGEKDWEYRKTFSVSEEILSHDHVELVLEGIDTYGDIFINGYKIFSCDNMFREWRLDVKPYLKAGDNEIRVYFNSVFKVDFPKYLAAPFKLQAWPNNDQNNEIWLSLYARKAGYHYGWDWGPRLIPVGIWKDVYVESWDDMRMIGSQVWTKAVSKKKASMQVRTEVLSDADQKVRLTVSSRGVNYVSEEMTLKPGKNLLTSDFTVRNPELWWPNGLGEHPMYDFSIEVAAASAVVTDQVRTGIRTIKVNRDVDEAGQAMTVRVNGTDVFMKGANYIPSDNFATRVTEDIYRHTVASAAAVNMNMLRVWGGGIYEYDQFYDLCDEYGILVWQDMMFACGMFPADEHYLNSVSAEISDNIRRLRNHPSIALWNGNNENEISFYGWGWHRKYTDEQCKIYGADLRKLFYDVIPDAIYAQDPSRYYHPTSPITGYNGKGYNMGDVHFWSVWKGSWIEEYTNPDNIGRFMSEYGFQSYPEISSIEKFAKKKDWSIDSEVILAHQRAKNDATRDPNFGNNMMKMYMEHYAFIPDDFEDFIYLSQFMQAEAVKVGIEAHRRAKPYCMGTLYWQINDCWPAASWSSIDYYGKWKALQYYTKPAYSEILVSPYRKGENIAVKVISDRLEDAELVYSVRVMDFKGNVLSQWKKEVTLGANGCKDIDDIDIKKVSAGKENTVYLYAELTENGKVVSGNYYYPTYANTHAYGDVKPEISYEKTVEGVRLTIKADAILRGLLLTCGDEDAFFSDNYLTVDPLKPVVVDVTTDMPLDEFKSTLGYISYNSISLER